MSHWVPVARSNLWTTSWTSLHFTVKNEKLTHKHLTSLFVMVQDTPSYVDPSVNVKGHGSGHVVPRLCRNTSVITENMEREAYLFHILNLFWERGFISSTQNFLLD